MTTHCYGVNPALWRIWALVFIACAAAFVCYEATLPQQEDFGMSFAVARSEPGSVRVLSVAPNTPASQAGIKPGDLIEYGNTPASRAGVLYARAGDRVSFTIDHARSVTLVARARPAVGFLPVSGIRLAFLFVAGLLAWRRPDDTASRALTVFLACYGLAIAMNNGVLPSPMLSVIVLQSLTIVLFAGGLAAAGRFAATFPSGRAMPAPRVMATIAAMLCALAAIAAVCALRIAHTGATIAVLNAVLLGSFAFTGVLVVATLVVAYIQGDPSERQRRKWVFAALAIGLLGPTIDLGVQVLFGVNRAVDEASLLPLALLPAALAYAILRHRVIDVGFVLSRAVVYAIVSAIIVGIFMIFETLVTRYLEQTSHVEGLVLQLALALVLGFSVRAIHARVDAFVDSVLFRERRQALDALHAFAVDAPFMTDAALMLQRAVATVERTLGAHGAGVWLRTGSAYEPAAATFAHSPPADENDAGILAMRARHVPVGLPMPDSVLPGSLALPMAAWGELVGTLVCGPKGQDEAYDPDERQALASLAASIAHGLDAIELRELRRGSAATREAPAAF